MTLSELAELIEYPRAGARRPPALNAASLEELEEIYTHTFDLNPTCSLEVGWHLFGEEYARGAFLVRMRQELRRHGIAESAELPDHLTHVLRLLARMEPGEARELAARFVLPALDKMLAALQGKGNPYESVLQAIRAEVASLEAAV